MRQAKKKHKYNNAKTRCGQLNTNTTHTKNIELTYEQVRQRVMWEEQARKELEEKRWDDAISRVHQIIGLKDYDNPKDIWRMLCNTIGSYLKLRKVKTICNDSDIVTFVLMRMLCGTFLSQTATLIGGSAIILFVLALGNSFLWLCALAGLNNDTSMLMTWDSLIVILLSYSLWVLHGLLMAASFEIDHSKDKKHISMMFSAVMTIVIAIVTIGVSIIIARLQCLSS